MIRRLLAASLLAMASPAAAEAPKLLVVIAVDQLSADLFAEYRPHFTGGLKRLSEGVVFPSGYQSHAATETCPGHATILTGAHPARSGIIANSWIDQSQARDDKGVYCAEDRTRGASSKAGVYVASPANLKVPTLGDRMKAADPRSRVVAVAGKDRAALMMGGHATDQVWWLRPTDYARFETLAGRAEVPAVARRNAAIERALARAARPLALSPSCARRSRAVPVSDSKTIGNGRFARDARDTRGFRASPESDAATLALAADLRATMKLGQGPATDLIAIGLSATDVVGHSYGTEGSEICLQLTALDTMLGGFMRSLDAARIDYAVVLTADHGGHDATERNAARGVPDAQRIDVGLSAEAIGAALRVADPTLPDKPLLATDAGGDYYVSRSLTPAQRTRVKAQALARLRAHPMVAAVLTGDELAATPASTLPPEAWTLAQRARASYVPGVSGDFVVLLRPRVTPITRDQASKGSVATHGSPWDYDRRVPILFWRKGLAGFEQPNSVEVVDIAPTLAALIGLPLPATEIDGVCRDLDAGPASSCR